MKRYFLSSIFLSAFFASDLLIADIDQNADACKKGPRPNQLEFRHIEASGIGYNSGYSTVEVFLSPSDYFGDRWFPFFDFRAHLFNNSTPAVNAGLGLRYLKNNRLWGFNTYYDYRKTDVYHYNQIGVGFETLGEFWDLRLNGYIPINNHHTPIYDITYLGIVGHYPTYYGRQESSLGGFDLEVGAHVNYLENFPAYFAASTYYLTGHDSSTWGGQLRGSIDIYDYLRIEANTSYDGIYHWIGQGQLSLIVPIGERKVLKKGKDQDCKSASLIAQRSVQKVYRHEIIPTEIQQKNQIAINPGTGLPYYFIFVGPNGNSDGTINDPYGDLHEAIANSHPFDIFYISGDNLDGEQATYDAGSEPFTFLKGQQIFGSSVNPITLGGGFESQLGVFPVPYSTLNQPKLTADLNTTIIVSEDKNNFNSLEIYGEGNDTDHDQPLVLIPEVEGNFVVLAFSKISTDSEFRNLVSISNYSGLAQFTENEFNNGNSILNVDFDVEDRVVEINLVRSSCGEYNSPQRIFTLNQDAGEVYFFHSQQDRDFLFEIDETYSYIRNSGGYLSFDTYGLQVNSQNFMDIETSGNAQIETYHYDLNSTLGDDGFFDKILASGSSDINIEYLKGSLNGSLASITLEDSSKLDMHHIDSTFQLDKGLDIFTYDSAEFDMIFYNNTCVVDGFGFINGILEDQSYIAIGVFESNVSSTSSVLFFEPSFNRIEAYDESELSLLFQDSIISSDLNMFEVIADDDALLALSFTDTVINFFGESSIFDINKYGNSLINVGTHAGSISAQFGSIAEITTAGTSDPIFEYSFSAALMDHEETNLVAKKGHIVSSYDDSETVIVLSNLSADISDTLASFSNDQIYPNTAKIRYIHQNTVTTTYNGVIIDAYGAGEIDFVTSTLNEHSSIEATGEFMTQITAQEDGNVLINLDRMDLTCSGDEIIGETYKMHNIVASGTSEVTFTTQHSDLIALNFGLMSIEVADAPNVDVTISGDYEYNSVIESGDDVFDISVSGNGASSINITTADMDIYSPDDFVSYELQDTDDSSSPVITFTHDRNNLYIDGAVHYFNHEGEESDIDSLITVDMTDSTIRGKTEYSLPTYISYANITDLESVILTYNNVDAKSLNGLYYRDVPVYVTEFRTNIFDSVFEITDDYFMDVNVQGGLPSQILSFYTHFENSQFIGKNATTGNYLIHVENSSSVQIDFNSLDCQYITSLYPVIDTIEKGIFYFGSDSDFANTVNVTNSYPEIYKIDSSGEVFKIETTTQFTLNTENLYVEYVAGDYINGYTSDGDGNLIINNDGDSVYGLGGFYFHNLEGVRETDGFPEIHVTSTDCHADTMNMVKLINYSPVPAGGDFTLSYDNFEGENMTIGLDADINGDATFTFDFLNSSWEGNDINNNTAFLNLIAQDSSSSEITIAESDITSVYGVVSPLLAVQTINCSQDAQVTYDVTNSIIIAGDEYVLAQANILELNLIGGTSSVELNFTGNILESYGARIFDVVFEDDSVLTANILTNTIHSQSGDSWEQKLPGSDSKGCIEYVGNAGDTSPANDFSINGTVSGSYHVNYQSNSRSATIEAGITQSSCP